MKKSKSSTNKVALSLLIAVMCIFIVAAVLICFGAKAFVEVLIISYGIVSIVISCRTKDIEQELGMLYFNKWCLRRFAIIVSVCVFINVVAYAKSNYTEEGKFYKQVLYDCGENSIIRENVVDVITADTYKYIINNNSVESNKVMATSMVILLDAETIAYALADEKVVIDVLVLPEYTGDDEDVLNLLELHQSMYDIAERYSQLQQLTTDSTLTEEEMSEQFTTLESDMESMYSRIMELLKSVSLTRKVRAEIMIMYVSDIVLLFVLTGFVGKLISRCILKRRARKVGII